MGRLRVGGLVPFTTIDYPGCLAAVVFLQGCPWRCRYCHNGHLLSARQQPALDWRQVLGWLERRHGLLDAVVFSGGEPTAQAELPDAIALVRALGFRIGLHSAGGHPARLARLLPEIDWIGLDIKALPEDYPALTGVAGSGERAWRSLGHVLDAGIPHEIRVTAHSRLLPPQRLQRLLGRLHAAGVSEIRLQQVRSDVMLDGSLGANLSGAPPGSHRILATSGSGFPVDRDAPLPPAA